MKKIHLSLCALFLLAGLATAQNTALNTFIDKYKDDQGFTFTYLSKELFEVATDSKVELNDWKKLQQVVKNIGSLRILAADDIKNGQTLYREALTAVPTSELDLLISVRDAEDQVRIWSKDDGNSITDLVLLVGTDEEFVLACFTGTLELSNITELSKMFNAAEVEELAKATQAVSVEFGINPNPSNGAFTLVYSNNGDLPAEMNIADQNGRLVSTHQLTGDAKQRVQLPNLPAGLYWVQLKTQNGNVGVKQIQIVK